MSVTDKIKLSTRLEDRPFIDACSEDELVARLLTAKSMSAGNQFIAVGARAMNGRVALRAAFAKLLAVAREKKAGQDKKKVAREARRAAAKAIEDSVELFVFEKLCIDYVPTQY